MGNFIEELVLGRFRGTVNQFELCICAELKVAFLRQTFVELNGYQ